MRQTPTAMPLVDALKAFACLTIVIHHLCFYGPLTDAVRPWLPGLIGFFDVLWPHGGTGVSGGVWLFAGP